MSLPQTPNAAILRIKTPNKTLASSLALACWGTFFAHFSHANELLAKDWQAEIIAQYEQEGMGFSGLDQSQWFALNTALDNTKNASLSQPSDVQKGQTTSTQQAENQKLSQWPKQLPNPLSLKQALAYFNESDNPNRRLNVSQLDLAKAKRALLEAKNGFSLDARGDLVLTEPASRLSQDFKRRNQDHELHLSLSKPLYDFGRYDDKLKGSQATIDARGIELAQGENAQYLKIMRAFFDVIIADMQFDRDNEALALAFIRYDRAREKSEMKKVSELEVLRLQHIFQSVSQKRYQSQSHQRMTRAILAARLNRPEQLPADLELPEMDDILSLSQKRELAPVEDLVKKALANNSQLLALQKQLEAKQAQLSLAQKTQYPTIKGELKTSWYSRQLSGNDDARASINIHVPIYQGGQKGAKQAMAQSEINQLQASIDIFRLDVKQQILELWLAIDALKQQFKQTAAGLDYRQLYLDNSRTNYELERKSDIGDAMVELSQAQLMEMKTRLDLAYHFAKLDILVGQNDLYAMENSQ